MIKEQRAYFGERKGYSSNNGRRLGEDQPEPVPMVTANDGTRSAIMGELTLCSQEQGKTECAGYAVAADAPNGPSDSRPGPY